MTPARLSAEELFTKDVDVFAGVYSASMIDVDVTRENSQTETIKGLLIAFSGHDDEGVEAMVTVVMPVNFVQELAEYVAKELEKAIAPIEEEVTE